MKEKWLKIKEWYTQLALREKRMVICGGSVLAVFILYQGVFKPMLNHLDHLRQQIVTNQKTLSFVQSADKAITATHVTIDKPVSLVDFLSQLQTQVKSSGLESFLTQLKQSANESVEMHFQKVEFDKLMTFLLAVMKQYPISITQMSIVAIDSPGYVNADIILNQT